MLSFSIFDGSSSETQKQTNHQLIQLVYLKVYLKVIQNMATFRVAEMFVSTINLQSII